MNFFVNRAMGFGNSGVEHAEFYRAKLFDKAEIPYRFVFVQLIKELHPAMDVWNIDNKKVINMYEYFVLGDSYLTNGVEKFYKAKEKVIVDSTKTNRMVETITTSGMRIVETAVKYESRKKKGLLLVSISNVEIYSCKTGERKVLFDFYDNMKGGVVIRNIHLFDQNGEHLFFWNEIQLQRYFLKKIDEAYGNESNWFLDRGEESEVALLYSSFPGSKFIEVIHADHLSDRTDKRYPLWNNYYEYALTHVNKIDKLVSGTEKQTQDLLIDFPGQEKKFVTIPVGGVRDGDKKIHKKEIPPLHLITASRLAGEKHIDIAVRAVAKIRNEGREVYLDIYGAGGEEGHLRDTIKTVGAEEYIKMKGLSQDLDSIYPKYDAFITASWSEGFGLTTVEALNAGLPVVSYAARFGSLEMIQDGINGFLQEFKPGDQHLAFNVQSLENGIRRLLESDYSAIRKATQNSMLKFKDHVIEDKWRELVYALRNNKHN
ncbi:glycosyltransferase [Liquorilactobacillus aquaticus DSM 21051]|uniref:Glycosyltransferase n=1 Tax=Liquorilactobacillus aquaticus DSM 21051 TaxID=1423725 RepID=A0A0R2CTC8_9LACO|nr:glycosyltransferase [Liquorilactobacillus aquaticus]KRM95032.1 glycosyltransferase [Liquorilactobacillus aquaticus DSM 21051]